MVLKHNLLIYKFIIATLCTLPFHLQATQSPFDHDQLVIDARKQIGVTVSYDSSYQSLDFPGGDVPQSTGVCTDVIIRAYRLQNIDLQALVHTDMKNHFSAYPNI